MSSTPVGIDETSDLPLSTSVQVLGARVSVSQRSIADGRGRSRHDLGVRVEEYEGCPFLVPGQHKYLASWARRVLFDGAEAGGSR